ncbi:hypothetical protein [Photobacterium halotolerans]|uniref:hypothetical protein n=1 Tax=Photobacterium halotolerans TaxID=265726 RepID=UPI00040B80A8|nr:hypothetical protein [Photobacterium halotolerans]
MFLFFKRLFSKPKLNNHEQVEPLAILHDVFWKKFAEDYAKLAINVSTEDGLPKLDHNAQDAIKSVLKPVLEANTLRAQRLELRRLSQIIISRRAYIMAYYANTKKFNSLDQYLSILKSLNIELSVENEMELILALKELTQWYAVVLCTAGVLNDRHEFGWFQCYDILYEYHANQLIEHGEVFQDVLNDEEKPGSSTAKQAISISNLILLEKFIDSFHQNIMQGEPRVYDLQKIADTLEKKEYMQA